MVGCPNCGGKGTWRRKWNVARWGSGGESVSATRFRDEICPRCEGKGVVKSLTEGTARAAADSTVA